MKHSICSQCIEFAVLVKILICLNSVLSIFVMLHVEDSADYLAAALTIHNDKGLTCVIQYTSHISMLLLNMHVLLHLDATGG